MQAPPTIETCQLLLRPPQRADVDPLFEIQGDPEAMQFTYCAPSREDTARHLETYAARFAEDGFSPWTAVCRSNARVVGWGGLNRDPKAPHWGTEVSYFFHPAYWARGLATELVTASLELAFGALGLPEVGAFTKPSNRASARVLRKTGFSFVCYVPELGRDRYRVGDEAARGRKPGSSR